MGKPWTEKLSQSQVQLMNEIIAQIPEQNGVRATYVGILQDLADVGDVQTRYIASGDGDVYGTNDPDLARKWAESEELYVVDALKGVWMCTGSEDDDSVILERPE